MVKPIGKLYMINGTVHRKRKTHKKKIRHVNVESFFLLFNLVFYQIKNESKIGSILNGFYTKCWGERKNPDI